MSETSDTPRPSDADLNDELTALIRPGLSNLPEEDEAVADLPGAVEDARLDTVQHLQPESPDPQPPGQRDEEGRAPLPETREPDREDTRQVAPGQARETRLQSAEGGIVKHDALSDQSLASSAGSAAPDRAIGLVASIEQRSVDTLSVPGPDPLSASSPPRSNDQPPAPEGSMPDPAKTEGANLAAPTPAAAPDPAPAEAPVPEPIPEPALADPGAVPIPVATDSPEHAPDPSLTSPAVFPPAPEDALSPAADLSALPDAADPEPTPAASTPAAAPDRTAPDPAPAEAPVPEPSSPTVIVPPMTLAHVWDALPDSAAMALPFAPIIPLSATPFGTLPDVVAMATPDSAVFVHSSIDLTPISQSDLSIGPLAIWDRPGPHPLSNLSDPGEVFVLDLPPLTLPEAPPSPPPGAIGFAPPIPLPQAPAPEAFRPTIRASSGTIVYNGRGELLNAPSETQMWDYLDPFGGTARGLTPEHVNATTRINNLTLQNDHPVSVTFIGEGAGHKNTLGYYKIGPDGEISDVRVIWANASGAKKSDVLAAWRDAGADPDELAALNRAYGGINQGGELIAGLSTVSLDNLQAGDSFGFFLVSNGFNNPGLRSAMLSETAEFSFRTQAGEPAAITPGMTAAPHLHFQYTDAAGRVQSGSIPRNIFHTAANGDTLGLNSSGHQQVISGVVGEDAGRLSPWGVQPGDLLVGFEDLARPGGDSDFNDIVFRLDVGPAFVETLDKVSNMPVVTVGSVKGGDPITRAMITFDGLDGAAVQVAGATLREGYGRFQFEGHDLTYTLDLSVSGSSGGLVVALPDGVPADVASRLLSAINLVPLDPEARTIPAGDRTIRFQLATDNAESDIVETVLRVAHNPSAPVNAPPSRLVWEGPGNEEIALRNAAAEQAWADETARVEAANAAFAALGAEVEANHVAAITAHAGLAEAHAATDSMVTAAEAAIARVSQAAGAVAEAEKGRAGTHAMARAAHAAALEASEAADAAALRVEDAQAQLVFAHEAALSALTDLGDLALPASQSLAAAETAMGELATRQAAAQTAAENANAALNALEASDAQAQTAFATALAAHAEAQEATVAFQSAQDNLKALSDVATADHARLAEAASAAESGLEALVEERAELLALDVARHTAHTDWSATPDDPAAQASFELAEAAFLAAQTAHLEALASWEALSGTVVEAAAAQAVSLAALDAAQSALSDLAQVQTAAANAAQAALDTLAEALAARDAAAVSHAIAMDIFAQADTEALEAQAEAETAASSQADAAAAYDAGLAAVQAGPLAALEAAQAAFADATAVHAEAARAQEASVDAFSEALAADAVAADAVFQAVADTLPLQEEAALMVAAVEAGGERAALALEAFNDTMADLTASLDAYADYAASHGIALVPGPDHPAPSPSGFLDIDHSVPVNMSSPGDELFDFATLDGCSALAGPVAVDAELDLLSPAEFSSCEDPGYDGLV